MPLRGSPLTRRILTEIPTDWTSILDLMPRFIELVPPGRALRMYEDRYEQHRVADGQRKLPSQKLEGRRALESGARHIVNTILNDLRRSGHIQFQGRRSEKMIRRVAQGHEVRYCCVHGEGCGAKEQDNGRGTGLAGDGLQPGWRADDPPGAHSLERGDTAIANGVYLIFPS